MYYLASLAQSSADSRFPTLRCNSAVKSQIRMSEYIGSELLTRRNCEDIDDAISDKVFSTWEADTL